MRVREEELKPGEQVKEAYIVVPGDPKGKGRPRFVRNIGRAITPTDTRNYENLVKIEYQQKYGAQKFPDDSMVRVWITAYYSIPNSTGKMDRDLMIAGLIRPTKKPDCDNVVKIICDALNGLAYHDDSQIVDCFVSKFYSENPKVIVKISTCGTKSGIKETEKSRRKGRKNA